MAEQTSLAKTPPLLFGRVTRVLFGLGTLYFVALEGTEGLGAVGFGALLFLGLSFLVGGLFSNPGCELSALPNLFLSRKQQFHFV